MARATGHSYHPVLRECQRSQAPEVTLGQDGGGGLPGLTKGLASNAMWELSCLSLRPK